MKHLRSIVIVVCTLLAGISLGLGSGEAAPKSNAGGWSYLSNGTKTTSARTRAATTKTAKKTANKNILSSVLSKVLGKK